MRKRTLFVIIPLVLVVFLASYYLFFVRKTQFAGGSALRAIPVSTPVLVRINDPDSLASSLVKNPLWLAVSSMPQLQPVDKVLRWADSLIYNYPEGAALFSGREWYVAFHPDGNQRVVPVFLSTLLNKAEAELLSKYIKIYSTKSGWQAFDRKYQRITLHELNDPRNGQKVMAWAISNGIVMISPEPVLVEDAIREANSNEPRSDQELDLVLKTIGKQCDLNVIINHQFADKVLAPVFVQNSRTNLVQLKNMAKWSGFDVSFHPDKLTLSGFSALSSEKNDMASVWLKQASEPSKIDQVLPQSTAWFLNYLIPDLPEFFADYSAFLKMCKRNDERDNQLKKIQNLTGVEVETFFANLFDNEMAMAGLARSEGEKGWGQAWIVGVKSGQNALEQMAKWQSDYVQKLRLLPAEWNYIFQFDNTESYTIYKNPFPDLPAILFGSSFDSLHANYFTALRNHLLFTDSPESMASLIQSNILGETLNGHDDYNQFKASLTSKSNINLYCNTNVSAPLAGHLFNPSLSGSLLRNDQVWKFRMFDWQVLASGHMIYNNACLTFNDVMKSKPQTIWKSHLESPSCFKPQFVKNYDDPQNREIMVMDQQNNLYLINHAGRIVWKIKLDSPLMGEIYQIDVFKNGKLLYFFNTESKLYLIDRNGNFVENYPVNLREKATNGVAVFDYENNRDYRFFVACADKKVYAYETSGNLVEGWEIFQTDHEVKQKIEFFRSEGKDYIVVSDEMKDYILNRRGEIRVPTQDIYPHSPNNPVFFEDHTSSSRPRIIHTDTEGKIHYTYLDGQTEVVEIKAYPADHFFAAVNLDQDEALEYLFVTGNTLEVFNHDLKPMLQTSFDYPISHAPNVYTFSKNSKKIGLVSQSESLIYLVNPDGSLHEGFPLVGASPFSIGFITESSSNFNLLVGGPDGYIYNYYVE